MWVKEIGSNKLKFSRPHYISHFTPGYHILIGQNFLRIKNLNVLNARTVRALVCGLGCDFVMTYVVCLHHLKMQYVSCTVEVT